MVIKVINKTAAANIINIKKRKQVLENMTIYMNIAKYRLLKKIDKSIYYIFDSKEEADEWGKKHDAELGKTIDNNIEYKEAVKNWVGNNSDRINNRVLNTLDNNAYYFEEYVLSLKELFQEAKEIGKNIVGYHLLSNDDLQKMIESITENGYFVVNKFFSTSLSDYIFKVKDQHYSDYDNYLKLYINSDVVGVYLRSASFMKNIGTLETEYLIAPCTALIKFINSPHKGNEGKNEYECILEKCDSVNSSINNY